MFRSLGFGRHIHVQTAGVGVGNGKRGNVQCAQRTLEACFALWVLAGTYMCKRPASRERGAREHTKVCSEDVGSVLHALGLVPTLIHVQTAGVRA